MKINFSGWGQRRFRTWLTKQYPDPGSRWVEVTLNVHDIAGIFKFTMADAYDACINELAYELAMRDGLPDDERWDILIRPVRRRKKKEVWQQFWLA